MSVRAQLVRWYETHWQGRETFRFLDEFQTSQYAPAEAMNRERVLRLQSLLSHAMRHTRHYKEAFRTAGIDPAGVRSLSDLANLPVVERQAMQNDPGAFTSNDRTISAFPKATGGSTGEPLRFLVELSSDDRRMAASHRAYGWAGAPPGERVFYLWGVPSRAGRSNRTWLKPRLHHALYGRIPFSTFELGPSSIRDAHRTLLRATGGSVIGFSSSVFHMAQLMEEEGLQAPPLKSIVVGAEKLHPHMRELVQRIFKAPVFETYGSREFMLIGAECEMHCGLHLTAENHIVEVVDSNGKPVPVGEEGAIAITDLTNRAFPFVRYLNGDTGVLSAEACACGRTLPLLSRVVGRTADILTLSNGISLSGLMFPHLLKDVPGVRRYQVEQGSDDDLTLRLVPGPHFHESSLQPLLTELAAASKGRVRLQVELVDEIPLTAAGKHRVVIGRTSKEPGSV